MGDISLTWSEVEGAADLAVQTNDLATDAGLEAAVLLSLFTDRRAEDSDELPDEASDRRGWWGDAFPEVPEDQVGSRLWLLARSKQEASVLSRAEEYAREALKWMLDDRVTDRIDIVASYPVGTRGALNLEISIFRPATDPAVFRFSYNWTAQAVRRGFANGL